MHSRYRSCTITSANSCTSTTLTLSYCFNDFRSLALVCRDLTFHAQARMFRAIHSWSPDHRPITIATRLSDILASSPHLLPLVHVLSAPISEKVLLCVKAIHLPCLHELHLDGTPKQMVNIGALAAARELLALPSLRAVVLEGEVYHPNALSILFELCTTNLRSVAIALKHPKAKRETQQPDCTPLSAVVVTSVSERNIPLAKLSLDEISPVVECWLSSDDCPFDLGGVDALRLHGMGCQHRSKPLHPLDSGAESARLSPSLLTTSAGTFNDFTTLRTLKLTYLDDLLTVLSSLPSRLETLENLVIHCVQAPPRFLMSR
ncbi:hypothetical protein R3P38DRAFT_3464635 [Favolaschia claudopus]|uniref:Uncharacterized protein n=1 Tax=Favolaschia claudopus TaxID=2862362 RepID=A0AAV9ZFE3_9AGAR